MRRSSTWHENPAPRCSTAMRRCPHTSATTGSSWTPRGSARSTPATPSPPTACGHRCESILGLATPRYRGESHAFRQYFRDVGPRAANELFVWFEQDLLPGYAWSFPLPGGRANVGFGIHRGGRVRVADMKRLWPDLLARPAIAEVLGPDAVPEGPHRAWPLPARIDQVTLAARRTMFVGDAAAATDPMTGEGIGQALLTGVLAARAAEKAGPFGADTAMRHYTRAATDALVADHRMSMLMLRILERTKGTRAAIRLAAATGWTRTNFARWMFEDYPRSIITTPRRWHGGMFTGPGSYRAEADG